VESLFGLPTTELMHLQRVESPERSTLKLTLQVNDDYKWNITKMVLATVHYDLAHSGKPVAKLNMLDL
jgi:hypothetical protein